jgi:hypothetical protein
MGIEINNGIINAGGMPEIGAGLLPNDALSNYSLWYNTDDNIIYVALDGTWQAVTGGGGATPGITQVLSVNNISTAIPLYFTTTGANADTFIQSDGIYTQDNGTYSGHSYSALYYNGIQGALFLGDQNPTNGVTVLPNTLSQNRTQTLQDADGAILLDTNFIIKNGFLSSGIYTFNDSRIQSTSIIVASRTGGAPGIVGILRAYCDIGYARIFSLTTANSIITIDNSQVSFFIYL